MYKRIDLTGVRIGGLDVKHRLPSGKWLCECMCGNTVERGGDALTTALREGRRSNCGCQPYAPVRYAYLYNGEMRSIPQLVKMTGIRESFLRRWAREGRLSEVTIDMLLKRRVLRKNARAAGISSRLVAERVACGMSYEDAHTTPPDVPCPRVNPTTTDMQLATTFRESEVSSLIALVRKASASRDLQQMANSHEVGTALRKLVKLRTKAEALRAGTWAPRKTGT